MLIDKGDGGPGVLTSWGASQARAGDHARPHLQVRLRRAANTLGPCTRHGGTVPPANGGCSTCKSKHARSWGV